MRARATRGFTLYRFTPRPGMFDEHVRLLSELPRERADWIIRMTEACAEVTKQEQQARNLGKPVVDIDTDERPAG